MKLPLCQDQNKQAHLACLYQYVFTRLQQGLKFFLFSFGKFRQERCFDIANALSYSSLLSIVPLMAVIFAALSIVPEFQDLVRELEAFIFSNFIPASSDAIREAVMSFVKKTSSLTRIGVLSLFLIALFLMWKIDQVFNHIWSVKKNRSYVKTFLTYWAILTLGPIFIGVSLMATSYLTTLPVITDTAQSLGMAKYMLQMVAIFFTFIAFYLSYQIIPNTRVKIRHALFGAMLATLLFELSKQGFAWYISSNQTYQNIYGALSVLPIFLIWIYISWVVILYGAIITRCLDIFIAETCHSASQNPFFAALYIIFYLWQSSSRGLGLDLQQLKSCRAISQCQSLEPILEELEKKNWIHQDHQERWFLSRDISQFRLKDFYHELSYELPLKIAPEILHQQLEPIKQCMQRHLDVNLKKVFQDYQENALHPV